MSAKRKAFLTGGNRGIGAAIQLELLRRGFEVWAPARAELDLSNPASIDHFTKTHAAEVDALVNNAGINILKPIPDFDAATWAQIQQVNLAAPLALIQWAAPFMRRRRWGRILNISSVFSLVTLENRAPYSMTKAALNALTRNAAIEFGPDGVLVNALCPGYVETEMTTKNNPPAEIERIKGLIPLQRMARPEEMAQIAGFLCSEENNYITGQAVVADGGFTLK